MKFPTDRPVKVVMLGAGGTGGYVAPYVFRLLHMLDRPARFVVCDGDIVEPKNLDRQNFVPADLGENKARVLAERYSTVLGMETEYVPSFIEKLPDLMELIEPKEWELSPYSTKRTKEMVLLLGCVDNNKTRQLGRVPIRQKFEKITKSASVRQDWTKQATFNFGWMPPVFVHLRVEFRLFSPLCGIVQMQAYQTSPIRVVWCRSAKIATVQRMGYTDLRSATW